MRPALVSAVLLLAACSSTAPPSVPGEPPPVVASAPAPPATAPPAAPQPAARAVEAPPEPPMAMRWSFRLPSFEGQPWRNERLSLDEHGDASWESERGEGDGEVDEELSPARPAPPRVDRCRGHLGPDLHRKLVLAAQRAMASGCAQKGPSDRLGRGADAATTTIAVTWQGEVKSCEVAREGGGYAAFERVRSEVIGVLCGERPSGRSP